MEMNILERSKELSNFTGCSVEEALRYLKSMIVSGNQKKYNDDNIDYNYSDYIKENRVVNSFIDYFIETKGKINFKELGEDIPMDLSRADESKLKILRETFHNIEDRKLKINLLKTFNDLSLFKKEDSKEYNDYVKEYHELGTILNVVRWNNPKKFNNYLLHYRFFGENKSYAKLTGLINTKNHTQLYKQMKTEVSCWYSFVFDNFPELLLEFKMSSMVRRVPYDYSKRSITKTEILAMYLEEGTLFELIKYKKKYYDSIKKKHPIMEGKTIYKANQYNYGSNKEEIDNFLEETFGLDRLNKLVKKDIINNEI